MTISPKKISCLDKEVDLHMQVRNPTSKKVFGTIKFKIYSPHYILIKEIKIPAVIPAKGYADKTTKYKVEESINGKYRVIAEFVTDSCTILSDTVENDYFVYAKENED
jgi:hypothetical protein